MERIAFHPGHELNDTVVANVLDQPVDNGVSELAVSHLAPLKPKRGLHLVAVLQEADRLVAAGLVVVVVDGNRELDFLDGDGLLALAGRALALLFLVEKLAVVLNAANRRHRGRRDFNQVETALAGNFERFKWGKDAELLALLVDDADFAGADALIDADKLFRRTFIDGCFSSGAEFSARHQYINARRG
jgi:hypothetical protein